GCRRVGGKRHYAGYGGAPVGGVGGGVVICHGSSDARAVMNGVRMAGSLYRYGVEGDIALAIEGKGNNSAADSAGD
ncbi:MAG: phosphate--acyl-ACP acyltransferase, partial [Deltaproteobacteria bacterium]